MTLDMILGAIAGLCLFLYGMKMMADGLQKVAGNKLKGIIQSLTRNRFMAVLVGAFVTMVIQSSSATSVMVVGFVNAGLMTLQQAVGIIFGANIGTTITAQLVTLNLSKWAPLVIGAGMLLGATAKRSIIKDSSSILVGFGMLFIGMTMLSSTLEPLKHSPVFKELIVNYGDNAILGIGLGFLMTLALQSSAATIGILIALASNGVVPFITALYIIFGDNIGTCTTALISSLSTSRKGKRVAIIHLCFNIIGTIYFVLFLTGLLSSIVEPLDPGNVPRQIANAHSLFNIINVIVLFPFANYLVKLSYWILPVTEEEKEQEEAHNYTYLDNYLLQTPAIALNNVLYEFVLMSLKAEKTMTHAIKAIKENDKKAIQKALRYEKEVNLYEKEIISYLVELSKQNNVSDKDLSKIDYLFSAVHDVERVSDHAENIAEYADELLDKGLHLGEDVSKELDYVYTIVLEGFRCSIDAVSTASTKSIERIIAIEREVDQLKVDIRDKHIRRMNKGTSTAESGIFVMDLLSNLERISDHCRNIAETVEKVGTKLVN
ncbi:sodium-dependent phosphate transporter [Granulicatella sp. zg-ZJ]|uniref:Na/Pi cotransporter family protein n=1 Tax=Granulicatella sp. zg-ZJ TaxID=2678504 RepID=UPI0013D572E6|nr:Na/Pi cotransporter family protein [Granulicatella sp. zg-ZJ]MBS4750771.1 Na/Pi cotransporter family protein [Carnobacteriaceae bacterium zg-ZUI78]NEW63174.1 sodium-dependent phosphate transporter [Granulicatella sp. zg-ZJ]